MTAYKTIFAIVIGALSVGAMTVMDPRTSLNNQDAAPVLDPVYAPAVEEVETHELERGQTLSTLLMRASISGGELAELLRSFNGIQNTRELREGVEVTIRRSIASGEARSIEVRVDKDVTIRATRSGYTWTTARTVVPTVMDTVFVAGTIEEGGSLNLSIALDTTLKIPHDERQGLVSELADIFEYKVDFLKEIRAGDTYALAFEREARPDGSMRSHKILVARLENQGRRYDAVRFAYDGRDSFYDLEGKSLRAGFRRFPIDYPRITSSFAAKRYHPILGIYRAHMGTDFGANTGTPVRAVGDGTVTFAGRDNGYGNVVVLRHSNGYTTRYAHLSSFGKGVRSGKRVLKDDIIGKVGMTGLATGPHLHYELRQNGKAVDFSKIKLPSASALPVAYKTNYRAVVNERLILLENAVLAARYARNAGNANPAVGGGS